MLPTISHIGVIKHQIFVFAVLNFSSFRVNGVGSNKVLIYAFATYLLCGDRILTQQVGCKSLLMYHTRS